MTTPTCDDADATYAEQVADWLVELGFTHCLFVAGGNIMHLLNASRTRFTCVPVVHEVAAGIGAEYFNEIGGDGSKRAFALVTAGPGLTNIVTAIAGAWLEGRELLVIGGQVRSDSLATDGHRQIGLQEIGGVEIVSPITKAVRRLTAPLARREFIDLVELTRTPRKGPVFIEMCLDVQGKRLPEDSTGIAPQHRRDGRPFTRPQAVQLSQLLSGSQRPILLVGGGLAYEGASQRLDAVAAHGLPIMTTWNGADRFTSRGPLNWGRPNHFGQRSANILLQQSDLLIALGTRLGVQQTGFNLREFAPLATKIQVDLDPVELKSTSLGVVGVCGDASSYLDVLLTQLKEDPSLPDRWLEWHEFGDLVRQLVPAEIPQPAAKESWVNPYEFMMELCDIADEDAIICPSSSGGTFTGAYQALILRSRQRLISNKSLASMGYGLAGANGLALRSPHRQVILMEGDGGFAQNLQELGTTKAQRLNVKVFIMDNDGYGSIRTTQKSYFNGERVGCDQETGLGLPEWKCIAEAFSVPFLEISHATAYRDQLATVLSLPGPALIRVPVAPDQPYLPKISSRVLPDGSMESSPLHLMNPALPEDVKERVFKFIF